MDGEELTKETWTRLESSVNAKDRLLAELTQISRGAEYEKVVTG